MRCILSENQDPYFNLASEEYLLKHVKEDVFLLYRNQPSIVVGKHQNALAEINPAYVKENGLLVARRISGGGTVYHDTENLNFAFLTNGREGELVDYKRHTAPIITALGELGLEVSLGGRNELLLGGDKISGTASHVYRTRVLHHGTLLFNTDLNALSGALKHDPARFKDRAVKSVPSRVTNIRDHLAGDTGIAGFQAHILQSILRTMKGARMHTYTKADQEQIRQLRDTRFSTWEWNYGYSPKYAYNKTLLYAGGTLHLHMNVEKGLIKEVHIEGDFLGAREIGELEAFLTGFIHDPETLRQRLSGVDVGDFIAGISNEQLLSGLF